MISDVTSSGEPAPYEAEKFGSSPEVLKGGRRRRSRAKKSKSRSRKSRRTRGGNPKVLGNGSANVLGGKSRRRRSGRRRR